jgi:hypothetical protein
MGILMTRAQRNGSAAAAGRASKIPKHYRAKLGKLRCESWGEAPSGARFVSPPFALKATATNACCARVLCLRLNIKFPVAQPFHSFRVTMVKEATRLCV